MDEEMGDLIEESIWLQQELGLLTPIMLFLNPSWNSGEADIEKLSTKGRLRFRERWKQLGGWDRVKIEYVRQERALKEKLSDLAEMLEEGKKIKEIERMGATVNGFKLRIVKLYIMGYSSAHSLTEIICL